MFDYLIFEKSQYIMVYKSNYYSGKKEENQLNRLVVLKAMHQGIGSFNVLRITTGNYRSVVFSSNFDN